MLARCPNCGKPVYFQNTRKWGECGYCYASFRLTEPVDEIKPGMIDWKKPLYDAVSSENEPENAVKWLLLLGDYADAPQRLARYRDEALEKVKDAENRISAAAESWQIELIIKDLRAINKALCGDESIDSMIAAAQEKKELLKQKEDQRELERLKEKIEKASRTADIDWSVFHEIESLLHVPGAAELLEKAKAKREALLREKELEEMARLKKLIHTAPSVWSADHLIEDLRKMKPSAERESILTLAYEKRAVLLQKEAEEEARRAKKEKLKKRLKIIVAAASVFAVICYGLLSYHIFQPDQLNKARDLARNEHYTEADAAYQSLIKTMALFANPSVKASARSELKALRNQWAGRLAEQGDKKAAIEKYEAAENEAAAMETRRAYAAELEEKGAFAEAIEQLEKMPDGKEKVPELYAKLAKQALEQGNYELALTSLDRSDPELAAAYQITKEGIYWQWGKALSDRGQTEEAIQTLKKAGNGGEVLDLLRALYVRQADEKGRALIEQWEKEGRKTDAEQLQSFAKAGAQFRSIDAQLHYWELLTDAEIDINKVYPAGVEVDEFLLPSETESLEEFDASKPLVFQRREKEYSISLTDATKKKDEFTVHDPQETYYFTVTMLPELWQRLPRERRADSLRDCTCVLLLNLTYQPSGYYYGAYRVKDYVSEMVAKQSGKKVTSTRTLESNAYFPLYTARMELLLLNYPGNGVKIYDEKSSRARYTSTLLGSRSVVVDWTVQSAVSTSTTQLGLSGSFDEKWITEAMKNCYEKLLGMGGE